MKVHSKVKGGLKFIVFCNLGNELTESKRERVVAAVKTSKNFSKAREEMGKQRIFVCIWNEEDNGLVQCKGHCEPEDGHRQLPSDAHLRGQVTSSVGPAASDFRRIRPVQPNGGPAWEADLQVNRFPSPTRGGSGPGCWSEESHSVSGTEAR